MRRDWRASDVHPMELERVRFHHVARHLYKPAEHWDHVIPNLGDARGRAWKAGCAEFILEAQYPDCDRAAPGCRTHVLQDHDSLLAPAYLEELSLAERAGREGFLLDEEKKKGPGWAFVGDRGVMVIVREVGPTRRPEVKSAYRVVPRKGQRPEDFFKAALQKLRDKTTRKGKG